jgi:hypothetical protein
MLHAGFERVIPAVEWMPFYALGTATGIGRGRLTDYSSAEVND